VWRLAFRLAVRNIIWIKDLRLSYSKEWGYGAFAAIATALGAANGAIDRLNAADS
jgi:hypothetical protein